MKRTDALIKESPFHRNGRPVYYAASFDVTAETKNPAHLTFVRGMHGQWVVELRDKVVGGLARDVAEIESGVSRLPHLYEVFDAAFLRDLEQRGLTRESYVALVQEAVKELT